MSRMNVSRPSLSLESLHPVPSTVHLEEGDVYIVFYLMSGSGLGLTPTDTLPVVLFLSLRMRGTPLLLLVHRILMILIIAIIINIIMIAIVLSMLLLQVLLL